MAKDRKIKIQFVTNEVLNHESITQHHQGIIAIVEDYKYCDVNDILDYAKSQPIPKPQVIKTNLKKMCLT